MKISRRLFLAESIASIAAIASGNVKQPRKIGILTDTHIGYKMKETSLRLEQCYRVFKAQGVDMIFNLGDICEYHIPRYYEEYSRIRNKVYPEGMPPEIFIFATHDFMKAKRTPGDKEHETIYKAVRKMLDIKHDRYHKFELCGMTFLVYPQVRNYKRMAQEIADECSANPGRPLFVLDHVPPANTVHGSMNGGSHPMKKLFDKHPEIIALSGHVHGSIVHEGKIWQGAFTAINFGTTKAPVYTKGGEWHTAIMELSPSRAVIHRYDIENGEELNPAQPWTLEFPFDPAKAPYNIEARRKGAPVPAFAEGASLDVRRIGKPMNTVSVTWPAAITKGISHYLVSVEKFIDGQWQIRAQRKSSADYTRTRSARATSFTAQFRSAYFNAGEKVRISVSPVDFFDTEGVPLRKEIEINEVEEWKTLYSGIPSEVKAGEFYSFKGDTWFTVPQSALDVPPGTKCRMIIDASLDMPEGVIATFKLRTNKSVTYAHQGYLYTPPGKSTRRYLTEFNRPAPANEPFNIYLQRAPHGKIRFENIRIETVK